MGLFRDRMRWELEIRGKTETTCQAYLAAMERLVRYSRRRPDELGPGEIKRYQYHLIHERELSYSTLNVAVSAFRFFYTHVAPAPWEVYRGKLLHKLQRALEGGRLWV